MMIVTTAALEPAANTLAAARTADGVLTKVFVTDGKAGIGVEPMEILKAIAGQVDRSGGCFDPTDVLIFGQDHYTTPGTPKSASHPIATSFPDAFSVAAFTDTGNGSNTLTDEPYAWIHQYRTGEIHANKFGYGDFSHLADYFGDLVVGRLPATSLSDANGEVAKLIAYEDHPPDGAGSGTFYGHVTESSFFQHCLPSPDTCSGAAASPQEEWPFIQTADAVAGMAEGDGKAVNAVLSEEQPHAMPPAPPVFYYDGTPLPAADVIALSTNDDADDANELNSDIDAGSFLVYHIDHGCDDGTCFDHPSYNSANVGSLTNGALDPVVWSLDCDVGQFDRSLRGVKSYPSLAETLIEDIKGGGNDTSPGGGAVGVIASTRASGILDNAQRALDLAQALFDDGPVDLLDQAELLSEAEVRDILRTTPGSYPTGEEKFEYFGDPSMDIWRDKPQVLTAKDFTFSLTRHVLVVRIPSETHPLVALFGATVTLTDHGDYLGQAWVLPSAAKTLAIVPAFSSAIDLRHTTGMSLILNGGGFEPVTVPVP